MEWSTASADMGMVGRHIDSWVSALGELQQPSLHALRAAFGRYPLSTHLPAGVEQADGEIAGVPVRWFLARDRLPGRHIVHVHGAGLDAIVSFSGWFDLAELPLGRATDAVVTRAANIPVSPKILAPGLPHVAQMFWRELPVVGGAVWRAAGLLAEVA